MERPELISDLAKTFGSQCVVVGVDSRREEGSYFVYQYTGDHRKTIKSRYSTSRWVSMVQKLGAGEIVLNCMNNDGMINGYDIIQLSSIRKILTIPLIASGGAGKMQHFQDVFNK